MPELNFVLPHWLYWSGLVLFPLAALLIYRGTRTREAKSPLSLPLGYFLLLVGGFIGVHRLYVKSRWALVFIAIFLSILLINVQVRDSRNLLSNANNEITVANYKIKSAGKALKKGASNAQERLEQARQRLADGQVVQAEAQQRHERWNLAARSMGGVVVALLLLDLFLLPGVVRRRNGLENRAAADAFECPLVEAEHDDDREPFLFNRVVSHVNGLAGEFVAYWSVIAVFVYYYEVMARYVFNSPTNWAHESMFLMFGMQYLLAGGFVLREGAHVRVDVIYMHLPKRGKAIVDLLTSVFFFIFMFTLLTTGWTFFMDSYSVSEVSFTEWGIQYWPIKFALPLGAVLLLLQGMALLVKDIAVVINPAAADLETAVRPEG
jgi:TRAP-type mannitol/chloroaromatic compound transport system permease small subunit